ncbi:MAG TPA: protein kinase [Clostridia bacterium]|nr:protein kinase [Clostridiales bacterium]MDD6721518.1 protein kinase [Clostridiales bacterium]HZK44723.1 protein kinase [Clostridia bacterium]
MIGKLISGRYLIESLIGSGGMANVYKAYDNMLGRTVALKVLKAEHRGDMEFVRRFEREARAVLTLSHENIVRSYAVGEDGDISYIVLEYVEGSTLKELIKSDGPISPKVAVSITAQVLDALAHAHESGIIHRDVKPQNVIITPRGKAKLTDFGIARDVAATTRTYAGSNVVMGSVHYISPEQARGDDVTAASDIYSCAIMLFEMLTGKVPFGGDNSVAIALKHLQEDITPPVEINPKIPRALSDVIVKAASKEISLRYQSAKQMKSDLLRSLREPHGKFARLEKNAVETKRRGWHGVMNIVLMLVVVLGLFTALFFIARSVNEDQGDAPAAEYIIPNVKAKKLEEAKGVAELRGFELNVDEYRSSDEEEGTVLEQTPAAGTAAKQGDSISVIVSSGNNYVTVPDLAGKYLQEANDIVWGVELEIGTTQYVTSDLPYGQIVRQEPIAGTDTFAGDVIDVWISGIPGKANNMPGVTDMELNKAIDVLHEEGFKKIRIRTVQPEAQIAAEGFVVAQNPTAGISTPEDAVVEISVCRAQLGNYAADVAFNLDITAQQSSVVVTAKLEEGLELIIYETTLSAGTQQSVSFTAFMEKGGQYECNVYVDGVQVRNGQIGFDYRR